MAVGAVERLDMEGQPGMDRESLEELANQLNVEVADLLGRKADVEDEERPPRNVERDPRQRFIHRQEAVGIADDAALVAERFGERLAERNADVLDRVVLIDLEVALGADRQVDERMARDLVEHMVEKADARRDVGDPRAVEEQGDGNLGLFRLARDRGAAHRLDLF